jgi:hypothetical protein
MAYQRVRLKQIIRQRCDLENTTFETESELDNLINDCAAVLHDLLISCAGSGYASASLGVTTVAGTQEYSIASTDLYRPNRISITFDDIDYPLSRLETEGSIVSRVATSWGPGNLPLYRMTLGSDSLWTIMFDPPPDSVRTVSITYNKAPPVYVSDSDWVSIPYVDYLIVEACIRIKDKEDRDTLRMERERAAIQKRIEDWGATFDRAQPFQTIDIYRNRYPHGRAF